ncbi:restriction endonuclease subunit S [Streptomyces sp. R08]|uniref:Restriction endonuclease subunit S n=1 Tax=Streptomyces sp. R08 TaxID=3238624 RepID=A0AB39M356_9ACTN
MKLLSEALSISIDSVPVSPNDRFDIAGVYGFGRGLFTREPIRGSETSYPKLHRLHAGDVVLSRLKAFEGAIAVVPEHLNGWFLSPEFPTFAINREIADPGYLQHLFRWPGFWELLRGESRGVGARRERVSAQRVLSIRVPLPDSVEAQQDIAARLDRLHEARHRSVKSTQHAEGLVASLHNSLCQVEAPRACVGKIMKLSRTPVSIEPEKKYSQIGVYSFGKGVIRRKAQPGSTLSKLKYYQVPSGALILSNIQAWEKAIALSDEADAEYVASQRFLPYLPKRDDEVDANYMRYFFLSDAGHPMILKSSPGTTARNRTLGIKAFENLLIPLPSKRDQLHIAAVLDRAYEAVRRMRQRNQEFDALYQAALSKEFEAAQAPAGK